MTKTLKKQPDTRDEEERKRKNAESARKYRKKRKQSGKPVTSTSPKDRTKLLEQQRQRQMRYEANKKDSKPFSDLLPVKFAEPKIDSKDQARSGKVPLGSDRAISLPEKSTQIEEPLFLSNDRPILVSEWLEASAAQSTGLDKITTKGKEEPLFLDDKGKEEPLFLDDGRTSNPRVTIWWTTMSPVTIR